VRRCERGAQCDRVGAGCESKAGRRLLESRTPASGAAPRSNRQRARRRPVRRRRDRERSRQKDARCRDCNETCQRLASQTRPNLSGGSQRQRAEGTAPIVFSRSVDRFIGALDEVLTEDCRISSFKRTWHAPLARALTAVRSIGPATRLAHRPLGRVRKRRRATDVHGGLHPSALWNAAFDRTHMTFDRGNPSTPGLSEQTRPGCRGLTCQCCECGGASSRAATS
jgi:hypothetical protein